MARYYDDWITAFMEYSSYGEAPRHMYFWVAISTLAGALRRRVWIDQAYFRWYPNFYIILVAPPGIVSKSTTASVGINLLKKVPGIKFGPDVVTWQALVGAFAEATELFEYKEEWHAMSAITIESSEFGNLLNPQDREMVDLLVSLWDGKQGAFEKRTKGSGNDTVENPWINLIACTTPSWIAGNFPEYMIGGGFTSRCIFVYADAKAKFVAYPGLEVPTNLKETGERLAADLEHISCKLAGEYRLTSDAVNWGRQWYQNHYEQKHANLDDDRFGGYLARKQTHIHKLAIIIAASSSDEQIITRTHLELANTMVTDLEPDLAFVFEKIGKSENAQYAERLVWYVHTRGGAPYQDVYRFMHKNFPSVRDYEDILAGCCRAGYVKIEQRGSVVKIMPGDVELAKATNGIDIPG